MFNSKKIKILSAGIAITAMSLAIGGAGFCVQMSASVSQPALRNEYKGTNTIQLDGAVSLSHGNQRISVSLRDSDLRQALRMIADKAGLNIIFHSSVDGTVTLDLVQRRTGITAVHIISQFYSSVLPGKSNFETFILVIHR